MATDKRPVRTIIGTLAAVPCVLALLPALVAAGTVAGLAWCVRTLGRLLEPSFVSWSELMTFDDRLGWRPRPHLDCHYLADLDDVHRIVTDREGWPGLRSIDTSPMLVIGDSFAFGYGVDTRRSFAEVVPDLSVKAVGAPGYSMVQGVLLMEQLGVRLNGKLVVWFIYPENDLQDNLLPEMRRYRAPFARYDSQHGRWAIADDHLAPLPWGVSDLDRRRLFPYFCVPGPMADRAYAACRFLIERAAACCRGAHARLAVVTIPHPMQLTVEGVAQLSALSGAPGACDPALPDRRIGEICRALDVPLFAGLTFLSREDYKSREGVHWNEGGHLRIAQMLQTLHRSVTSGQSGEPVRHRTAAALEPRSSVVRT